MNNVKKLTFSKICIFDIQNTKKQQFNPLKEFLYYLKFSGVKGVIDFAYSSHEDSLHKNLTVKQNLILDAIPVSLIKDGENNLTEFINTLTNPFLIEIIGQLGSLNKYVHELTAGELKMASIIKAILSQREYIFLVEPETNLQFNHIQILKDCIEFEVKNKGKSIFIKPANKDIWLDISTHIISRCEKTHGYQNIQNPLSKHGEVEIEKEQTNKNFNFKLIKKVA
ncbi:MAG: hypothetical protein CME66_05020 [Halobacteriovoraceae bacterium]|nr:hypothetical protein [Halobacteriovoraceae bacterium]|tara:strand:+ start:353 stop:1027 length:675 start_codon:yes stop_codon:yes gene_type:complete